MIANIRACLFYVGYILCTVVWGSLSVLVAWLLPFRWRFQFIIGAWTRQVLFWLWVTCGIRHEIIGLENIPEQPCIIFAKHESTWETLFLQTRFAPQATLIKQELLHIPFFGWAFRLLRPIAINRKQPRRALKKLITEGKQRLEDRIWVSLFPEGTRMPTGTVGDFQAGGAALASASNSQVLVVAHNAGAHWPAHKLAKKPGVIQVHIAPAVDTQELGTKEVNRVTKELMTNLVEQIKDKG